MNEIKMHPSQKSKEFFQHLKKSKKKKKINEKKELLYWFVAVSLKEKYIDTNNHLKSRFLIHFVYFISLYRYFQCVVSLVVVFLVYGFYSFSLCHVFSHCLYPRHIEMCTAMRICVCCFFLRNLPTSFYSEHNIHCALYVKVHEKKKKASKKLYMWSIHTEMHILFYPVRSYFILLCFLDKKNNDWRSVVATTEQSLGLSPSPYWRKLHYNQST